MTIELNGELVELQEGATVADAVAAAGAGGDHRGVAAAVGGEVVPRARWTEVDLSEGQSVEVVRAVQGG
jgi:sulfur carrier protein